MFGSRPEPTRDELDQLYQKIGRKLMSETQSRAHDRPLVEEIAGLTAMTGRLLEMIARLRSDVAILKGEEKVVGADEPILEPLSRSSASAK